MHKSATKCNKTLDKWRKNKHGASKIIDTSETYQRSTSSVRYGQKNSLHFDLRLLSGWQWAVYSIRLQFTAKSKLLSVKTKRFPLRTRPPAPSPRPGPERPQPTHSNFLFLLSNLGISRHSHDHHTRHLCSLPERLPLERHGVDLSPLAPTMLYGFPLPLFTAGCWWGQRRLGNSGGCRLRICGRMSAWGIQGLFFLVNPHCCLRICGRMPPVKVLDLIWTTTTG
jgi:hypothetical protein